MMPLPCAAYICWLVGLRWYATLCGLDLSKKEAEHE